MFCFSSEEANRTYKRMSSLCVMINATLCMNAVLDNDKQNSHRLYQKEEIALIEAAINLKNIVRGDLIPIFHLLNREW